MKKLVDEDIKLTVVGEGKLKDKAIGVSNIKLVGRIPNEKLFGYYDKNDVLILPSYTEAFPLTILESMARGLAIVTTKIPGVDEIVENERNGYLFRSGDVDKVVKIPSYLKNNCMLINYMSKNNLRLIKKYSTERVVLKYNAIFNDVCC